jgi:hypothetical protein
VKRAVAIAAIALAVIGVIGLRAVLAGRSALADGDDWMLRGKPAEAIRSYEAAARWYVPLAPHVDAAYKKLRALTGTPDALLAWRAIRSAARATRSLWQPHAADLADADAHIAALAGLGIVLGLLGAAVVVFRRWSVPAGVMIVVGVAVWLVGLYNA